MSFDAKKQFELTQVMQEHTSDLKEAAANFGKWINRKKNESDGRQNDDIEDLPEIRSLSYNSTQKPQTSNEIETPTSTAEKETIAQTSVDSTANRLAEEAQLLKQRGNRCIQLGQYDQAISYYTQAIEQHSGDPVFYCNRALCYLKLEKYDKCIEDCQLAIQINSRYTKAFYRRMQAHESLGNTEKALADCLMVLQLEPTNSDAMSSRKRIENRQKTQNSKSTQKKLAKPTDPDKPWSKLSGRGKECDFIEKSPELRSTEPLKTINITEINHEPVIKKPTSLNLSGAPSISPLNASSVESNDSGPTEDGHAKAVKFKDLGNDCVKRAEYDEAIMYYTQAIETYASNATFYCNRALCHLKLNRYKQCISDCDAAIRLNKTFVKAYYRRMQAHESMGSYVEALVDCNQCLRLEPNNKDVKVALNRLLQRNPDKDERKEKTVLNQVAGTRGRDIEFIKKPPHLRSNKPLQRIDITEISSDTSQKRKCSTDNVDIVATEVTYRKSNPLPVFVEPSSIEKRPVKMAQKKIVQSPAAMEENEMKSRLIYSLPSENSDSSEVPPPPNSGTMFYNTWKELFDPYRRYLYLKKIDVANINRLLGALFDSRMLTELLDVLSIYYIRDNCPVDGLLKEISKNDEFKILKMLLGDEDKIALDKLFKYMKSYHNNSEDIELLREEYAFESM